MTPTNHNGIAKSNPTNGRLGIPQGDDAPDFVPLWQRREAALQAVVARANRLYEAHQELERHIAHVAGEAQHIPTIKRLRQQLDRTSRRHESDADARKGHAPDGLVKGRPSEDPHPDEAPEFVPTAWRVGARQHAELLAGMLASRNEAAGGREAPGGCQCEEARSQ